MNSNRLTYETNWRCTHCEAKGVISIPFSEGSYTIFDKATVQHAEQSPECAGIRGNSGIALQAAIPPQEIW